MITVRDSRIVKASFRENPPEERKKFSISTCIMPISVGQNVHEGEKFEAVIKLVNNSFKHCTILIDDSVQRHTLGITNLTNMDELYHLAIVEGDSWLKRNSNLYNKLSIPFTITRWDDWYNNPNYADSYLRVKNEYESNELYKKEIDTNINIFLSRYLPRINDFSIDKRRAFRLCLDYLIEECAVMCLWPQKAYDFEIYPSGRNKAMAATYEFLIRPYYPNMLKPVALRFKKYHLHLPQSILSQDRVQHIQH